MYLKALEHYCRSVKIYYGHFLTNKIKVKVDNPPKGCPSYVNAINTKEKGSDVNLALQILNDAWHNRYECAVLVSNDSDIADALKLAKEEHNKKNRFNYTWSSTSQHHVNAIQRFYENNPTKRAC